jgi:hypothetical protein
MGIVSPGFPGTAGPRRSCRRASTWSMTFPYCRPGRRRGSARVGSGADVAWSIAAISAVMRRSSGCSAFQVNGD